MRNIISIMGVFSVLIFVQFIFGIELALNYLPIYITMFFSIVVGLIISSVKIGQSDFEINFSKQKAIFVLVALLWIVLINIYNSAMVNSQEKFNLIKTTEIELKDMSFNSHRTVTLAMAERTASEQLRHEWRSCSPNINRLAYIKSGLKLIETHFEINDLGEPYFISLILEPSIVFSGYKTKSVIVTNAQTKEMDFVNNEDIKTKYPWIDNIVSEEKTLELIEWNSLYSLGYLNTLFGAENVLEPTKVNSYAADLFIKKPKNLALQVEDKRLDFVSFFH